MTISFVTAPLIAVKDVHHILVLIRSMLTIGILIVIRDSARPVFN